MRGYQRWPQIQVIVIPRGYCDTKAWGRPKTLECIYLNTPLNFAGGPDPTGQKWHTQHVATAILCAMHTYPQHLDFLAQNGLRVTW